MSASAFAGSGPAPGGEAQRLREAFDASFAAPPEPPVAGAEDYVLVECAAAAGDPDVFRAALHTRALLSLERTAELVCVSSAEPALAGLAGIGGRVLPVFFLHRLAGDGDQPAAAPPPALYARVRLADGTELGLGFSRLVGMVRIAPAALHAGDPATGRPPAVPHASCSFAVVELAPLAARLGTPRSPAPPQPNGEP